MESVAAFLLTRHWHDEPGGMVFDIWATSDAGPVHVRVRGQEAVCFVPRGEFEAPGARREASELRTMGGKPVDTLYFKSQRALRNFRESAGDGLYESDLAPVERYFMERFVCGGMEIEGAFEERGRHRVFENPVVRRSDYEPSLRVLSLDIETSGFTGDLYSIAVHAGDVDRVFMVGPGEDSDTVVFVPDEKALMRAFVAFVAEYDPDVFIGWNVIDFDFKFLEGVSRRCGVPLNLGRAGTRANVLEPTTRRQPSRVRMPGRVVLDGIAMLRTATWTFDSFSLEHVANEVLGRGKLIRGSSGKVEEIRRQFREDKHALAAYNLEDCRLVREIFDATGLMHFAIQRAKLTGLPLDRQGGSVAAFEYQYLPRLHRRGHVAPDVGSVRDPVASPGGYVMDSQPGLYRNVLVLDFKSLYPSIIRTFGIDPLGMAQPGEDPIPGFDGAEFARGDSILPGLIASMWSARDDAKAVRNEPLSRAIKIIMNSFYGVLGTPGCRFFHPALASSITRRGHELITRSRKWIEGRGHPVIYGDTDSLFVHVGDEREESACLKTGDTLARELNVWWRERVLEEHGLDSSLEIEFETHYLRFFMPTIRGSEKGSKKRYAGLVRAADGETELKLTGLEAVRTDWTPLARRFQRELLNRVFRDQPYEEYVRGIADAVLAGEHDPDLYYTKRLRKKVEEYTKNVPPQVQAARQLERPGSRITYAVTVHGPQPVEKLTAALDYGHYLDRQLAPAVDGILELFGTSFDALTNNQLEMF